MAEKPVPDWPDVMSQSGRKTWPCWPDPLAICSMSCHAIEMPIYKLAKPLKMLVFSSLADFYDLL